MSPPLWHQTQQGGPHGYPTGQSSRPCHRSVGPTGEDCFIVLQLLLLLLLMMMMIMCLLLLLLLLLLNPSLDASPHLR